MKVLLIGGTGRLSKDTTELCIKKGFDVYLFNRGHKNNYISDNVHYLIGDINDVYIARAVLGSNTFDVVVDYLTYDLSTLIKRVTLFKDKTRQYIFISSATVYPIQDKVISESSTIGNDGWLYAKNKRLCEDYLRDNANELTFQYTIVRPYVTYDRLRIPFPIISKNSSWNLIYRILNDYPILMPETGEQIITLTSTIDFAVGIVGLFMNRDAFGEDFNIVGDTRTTWNEVLSVIEMNLKKKAKIVYVGTEELAKRIPILAEELMFDKAFSHTYENAKIKRVVPEFTTTIDIKEGMKQTISYLMNQKSVQVIDEYWNAMEDVLCNKFSNDKDHVSIKKKIRYFKAQSRFMIALRKRFKRL